MVKKREIFVVYKLSLHNLKTARRNIKVTIRWDVINQPFFSMTCEYIYEGTDKRISVFTSEYNRAEHVILFRHTSARMN